MNKPKRNAQNLASVYSSAVAAGAVELKAETELASVIELLVKGVNGGGSFSDNLFQVPNLSDEEAKEAMAHLKLEDGHLAYYSGDHHQH